MVPSFLRYLSSTVLAEQHRRQRCAVVADTARTCCCCTHFNVQQSCGLIIVLGMCGLRVSKYVRCNWPFLSAVFLMHLSPGIGCTLTFISVSVSPPPHTHSPHLNRLLAAASTPITRRPLETFSCTKCATSSTSFRKALSRARCSRREANLTPIQLQHLSSQPSIILSFLRSQGIFSGEEDERAAAGRFRFYSFHFFWSRIDKYRFARITPHTSSEPYCVLQKHPPIV